MGRRTEDAPEMKAQRIDMSSNNKKLIAVIGATGQQGGAVLRALQASSQFKVRALTRNPEKHRELADEIVKADLNRPETLKAAFEGAHGVFLVTNFREAGFPHHTFVIAPGYYQNFVGFLTPQKQADGSAGWALPLDPDVRCLHMGDIRELGNIVVGAFARPDEAGNGEYLPLVGDFLSFNEIVETLNRQGHKFSVKQVPKEVFATLFPGAAELAEMFGYWEAHTYLGSDSSDRIALANKIAGRQPTKFATWAQVNFPA